MYDIVRRARALVRGFWSSRSCCCEILRLDFRNQFLPVVRLAKLAKQSLAWYERNSEETKSTCHKSTSFLGKTLLISHLLDLQHRNLHASNDIWKKCYHIIVAHSHVCDNFLQGRLFGDMILVLLAIVLKLRSQLSNFALLREVVSITCILKCVTNLGQDRSQTR